MTEKRFKISIGEFEEENIIDTVKKIEITKISDMCIQMNTLYDENEQLKKDCTVLIYHNQEYREENEQLKADKQSLIDFIRKEFPKSHKHILEGFE